MGRTKDLQIEIQATMSAETYEGIAEHLRDQMKIKKIDAVNWRDEYKKSDKWKRLHAEFIAALQERQDCEAEIRAGL